MNETTAEPSRELTSLKFVEQLERQEPVLALALPTRPDGTQLLPISRFMRALVTTVSMTPRLLRADRRSFWDAAAKAAIDGLLPDGKEAALVPFNNRRKDDTGRWGDVLTVQYIPMIGGYRRLVREAGIDWQLRIVHEKDQFEHEQGDEERIYHVPSDEDDPGPWVRVYAIAKDRKTGEIIARDVMNRAAVFRIRDRSQGWQSMMRLDEPERTKAIQKSAWGQWEEEMALKTVAKRQVKVLPLSTDSVIYNVIQREEAVERGQDTIRAPIASTSSLSDKMRALADQREQEALAEDEDEDDIETIDEDGDVIDKETGEVTKSKSVAAEPATDAPEAQAPTSSQMAGPPVSSGAPNAAPSTPDAATAPAASTPPTTPAAGAGPAVKLTIEQAKQLRKLSEILMGAQSQRGVLKGVTNFLEDMSWPEGSEAEHAAVLLRDAHYRRIRGEGSPAECDQVRDKVTKL